MTWRGTVAVHPLADSFPLMSDGELKELAADINKNGQRDPVLFAIIDGKKVLIDGRNQLAACFLAKQEPKSETVDFRDEAAIETFIRSRNVYRRHLTPAERAAALRDLIKTSPEKSDRELAREASVDHKTIGAVRKKLETTGETPTAKRTGKDQKQYKATKARVTHKESALTPVGTGIVDGISAAINGFATESITAGEGAEKRKAEASEGNQAVLTEFKEVCARLVPHLRNLFEPVCREFRVPITNFKGWSDLNSRAAMMRRFKTHEAAGRR